MRDDCIGIETILEYKMPPQQKKAYSLNLVRDVKLLLPLSYRKKNTSSLVKQVVLIYLCCLTYDLFVFSSLEFIQRRVSVCSFIQDLNSST